MRAAPLARVRGATAVVALASSLVAGPAAAAPTLRSDALSAAGESSNAGSCALYGPDPAASYFGAGVVGVLLPVGSCGIAIDTRSLQGATGSVTASSELATNDGSPGFVRAYRGESTGRAAYGDVGAHAAATYTGSTGGGSVLGSQAFGLQRETMTFAGAAGAGTYRATLTIDGSLFLLGRGYSSLSLYYSVDDRPADRAFTVTNASGALTFFKVDAADGSAGFASTGDPAAGLTTRGSTTVTLDIPFTFGAPVDVTFAVWAAVLPGANDGLLTASSGRVDFLTSARLTGIAVLDTRGVLLDDVSIVSGSGTRYDRFGVAAPLPAIPEPPVPALLLLGLLLGALWTRRRHEPGS